MLKYIKIVLLLNAIPIWAAQLPPQKKTPIRKLLDQFKPPINNKPLCAHFEKLPRELVDELEQFYMSEQKQILSRVAPDIQKEIEAYVADRLFEDLKREEKTGLIEHIVSKIALHPDDAQKESYCASIINTLFALPSFGSLEKDLFLLDKKILEPLQKIFPISRLRLALRIPTRAAVVWLKKYVEENPLSSQRFKREVAQYVQFEENSNKLKMLEHLIDANLISASDRFSKYREGKQRSLLYLLAYNRCPQTVQNASEIIAFLQKHGTWINAKEDNGQTPLSGAIRAGNTPFAIGLVKAGADVNKKTPGQFLNKCYRPLSLAFELNADPELTNLLITYHAEL